MREPNFIKATDGNCGMYAVNMALNGLGYVIDANEIIDIAMENNLSISGELYRKQVVIDLIQLINIKYNLDLELTIEEFSTSNELRSIVKDNVDTAYILFPYYALQGLPITSRTPDMKRGHWALIYDIKGHKVYAKQSNSKADSLNILKGVNIEKLYKSNKMLYNIKVNMGKYNKCRINIPKKRLVDTARCGQNICELNGYTSEKCIFHSDLSGKAFIIK